MPDSSATEELFPGPDVLVVTGGQLGKGWLEKIGGVVYQREFRVIRQLDDGNWLVRDPGRRNK